MPCIRTVQTFTSHRADFESNDATGRVERQVQTVRAAAKSLVDNRGGKHHPDSAGAEIMRAAQEYERRVRALDVVVEQRQVRDQLKLAFNFEPAQPATFN